MIKKKVKDFVDYNDAEVSVCVLQKAADGRDSLRGRADKI